jgi:hypothetical protein
MALPPAPGVVHQALDRHRLPRGLVVILICYRRFTVPTGFVVILVVILSNFIAVFIAVNRRMPVGKAASASRRNGWMTFRNFDAGSH